MRVPGGRRATPAAKTTAPRSGRDPESELWSTFGYETICLLWGLPLKAVQALPEAERQRLARVSTYIDGLPRAEKEPLLRDIKRDTPANRLVRFRRIARTLSAQELTARTGPSVASVSWARRRGSRLEKS